MTLTIRNLSEKAEYGLAQIKKESKINTNTKAIEFVLEDYISKCDFLEIERKENLKLRRKLEKANDKLNSITYGFSIISEMIAKK